MTLAIFSYLDTRLIKHAVPVVLNRSASSIVLSRPRTERKPRRSTLGRAFMYLVVRRMKIVSWETLLVHGCRPPRERTTIVGISRGPPFRHHFLLEYARRTNTLTYGNLFPNCDIRTPSRALNARWSPLCPRNFEKSLTVITVAVRAARS